MPNPESPDVGDTSKVKVSEGTKSESGTGSGISIGDSNKVTTSSEEAATTQPDPVVLPDPLEISDAQVKKEAEAEKSKSSDLQSKSLLKSAAPGGSGSSSVIGDIKIKTTTPVREGETGTAVRRVNESEVEKGGGKVTTPSIVKPRRPSVHFAVGDNEQKVRLGSTLSAERVKQENGGSSSNRKHRSRKEKLVCRSESPTDMSLDANQARSRPAPLPVTLIPTAPVSLPMMSVPNPASSTGAVTPNIIGSGSSEDIISTLSKHHENDIKIPAKALKQSSTPINPTGTGTARVKPRVKRINSINRPRAAGSSAPRKKSQSLISKGNLASSSSMMGSLLKEPVVKKKRVIEIVSPRKRKMDHLDLVKTSSDPIFIRAANKPFKLKNKSRQNRLKFSRVNFNKSGSLHHGSKQPRARRSSSTSLQQTSSGSALSKQRYNSGSPHKKDREVESPTFPLTLTDDLMWMMEEAENVFSQERCGKTDLTGFLSPKPFDLGEKLPTTATAASVADPVPSTSSVSPAKRLAYGRRRVESEPPIGFEIAPNSPGSQSFYHIRKEVYFSPSPSYAATTPTGRRRYSRRRHAKIHPPFEETNCFFQGHLCSNSRVSGSQYCEKHLDQGPTSGYSHCRYMKDGRQCGSLFSSYDPAMTFCEQHANSVARTEYEQHNPKVQSDPAKSIVSKINTIFKEGFTKSFCNGDTSSPDILQIVEDPDIVQELSLGNFTGGLLEDLDSEGERNVNPDKPDYDALKNAGYFTTEEIIQIHISKLRKLKVLYQREKELEWLTRQHKLRFYKEGLEKLKQFGPRFTTNPYLINKNVDLPKEYIDHQIKHYDAAKAILQTAYKADGERGLLRLKMLQKTQELARIAKASGQNQIDTAADIFDSESDADSDTGESRDRRGSSRFSTYKLKCTYNDGYAVRACQNPPVYWSNFCFKHILSDSKQVQWVPCNRRIGPDPQDLCKTPCFRILQKHGCAVHSPLVMSKHKPLRKSEEELNTLVDTDNEEEEVSLEAESTILANLISDECLRVSHLDEVVGRVLKRGRLDFTDTSDSEETDEEGGVTANLTQSENVESSKAQYPRFQI